MMIELKLYTGKVISVDDEDKKGRIQIKILPEMKDVNDSDCPFLEYFFGNSSEDELVQDFPPVNTLVWCLCDENFYDKYYLGRRNIKGTYDFDTVKDLLDSIDDITYSDTDYKSLKFYLYEDGSLFFHNKSEGYRGFLHKDSTYDLYDKDGNRFIYGKDKDIKIYNDNGYFLIPTNGNIEINGDQDYAVAYNDLKTAFDQLKSDFDNFVNITYNLHTHATAPPGPISVPSVTGSSSSADMSGAKIDSIKVP
jgi:hypothetical protein